MEFDKISEYAYNQKEIPKIATLSDKYAYLQLSDLYYRYKLGEFSKEESIAKKQKIKIEYESNIDNDKWHMKIFKEYNDNKTENELMIYRLNKTNDKNEMLDILLKIVVNCTGDDTIYKSNISKIDKKNII